MGGRRGLPAGAAPGHCPGRTRDSSGIVKFAIACGLPVSGIAGLRFALESRRGRSTAPVRSVIVGAVLAITVVTATLTFGASLDTLISHPNLYGWNFDYAYYSTDGYGPVPTSIVAPRLARDHAVETTTGVYFATAEIGGDVVPLLIEPAPAAIAPPVLTGHPIDEPNQIVLGSATLAQLHKKLGDTVAVQGDGLPTRRMVIVGTATLPAIGTVLGVHPTMTTGAVIPTSAVPKAFLEQYGPDSGPNALFIRIRPGADPTTAARDLAKIAEESLREFITPQVVAVEGPDAYGGTLQLLGPQRPAEIVNYRAMGTTPGLLAGGLAVGAVAALGLTLVASMRQRRREAGSPEIVRLHPAPTGRRRGMAVDGDRGHRSGRGHSAGHRPRAVPLAAVRASTLRGGRSDDPRPGDPPRRRGRARAGEPGGRPARPECRPHADGTRPTCRMTSRSSRGRSSRNASIDKGRHGTQEMVGVRHGGHRGRLPSGDDLFDCGGRRELIEFGGDDPLGPGVGAEGRVGQHGDRRGEQIPAGDPHVGHTGRDTRAEEYPTRTTGSSGHRVDPSFRAAATCSRAMAGSAEEKSKRMVVTPISGRRLYRALMKGWNRLPPK